MINTEKIRAKWNKIDEDTKRTMKTGEEFYRWTVTPDMPQDVFSLLAEIEQLRVSQEALTNSYVKLLVHDIELMDAHIPGWRTYAIKELETLKELLIDDRP